jgi:hypothetical protein
MAEYGGSDPFAAEIDAVYVSGGPLTNIDPQSALDGKVLIPRLKDLRAGETMYVTRDSESLGMYDNAHITEVGALSKTRQKALSGIFFGQLSLTGETGVETTQMVAVKPMAREWMASHEYAMAHTLNTTGLTADEKGSQRVTFTPIGFHRLSDGKVAVLTAYEQRVKSFDNTLWVPPERRPSERVIKWALGNAAATLVFLHANSLVHYDYQVKNTAVDPEGSRVIDITSMKRVGGIGINAAEAYVGDLKMYIGSLNDAAHEHHVEPYVTEEQAREWFVEPYANCTDEIFGRRAGLKPMIDYKLSSRDLTAKL